MLRESVKLTSTQVRTLQWALDNEKKIGGGAIALKPGNGKTVTALALSSKKPPTVRGQKELYVLPPTLVAQWDAEVLKLTHLRAKIYIKNDEDRLRRLLKDDSIQILIVSYYTLLHADKEASELFRVHWFRIVADEAHQIRNPKAQISQCMQQLHATYRWVMSGTFLMNGTVDLFGICKFLRCDGHRTKEQFERAMRRGLVAQIMMQSSKEDIAALALPPLHDQKPSYVTMTPTEMGEYRAIFSHHRRVALKDKRTTTMLKLITDLRIAACRVPSKVQALMATIDSILRQNAASKILIFASFMNVIDTYRDALRRRGIKCLLYTGQIDQKERDANVARFKESTSIRVMILGFKCGNAGINLQCAQHVVLDSPNWHNAIDEQAIARAYRKGQENPVYVYRIRNRGTIEDRIAQIAQKKKVLIERALRQQQPINMNAALSKTEMAALLEI